MLGLWSLLYIVGEGGFECSDELLGLVAIFKLRSKVGWTPSIALAYITYST